MDEHGDQNLLATRRDTYRFLARIYRTEMTQILLDDMGGLSFPDHSAPDEPAQEAMADYAQRAELIGSYLDDPGFNARTDLAVDYTRVFLAAGIATGEAAFPYESVYTSPEHLIMQQARDEVVAVFRSEGVDRLSELAEPEDHIAFELEFMALLCQRQLEALAKGDARRERELQNKQVAFLDNHLLNWVPAFCDDVDHYASTDFYRGAAKMTRGFVRLDRDLLEQPCAFEPAGGEVRAC